MADLKPIAKWAYPVKLNGATTEFEPWLYFQGLARALGGSYPLGGNGLLHPAVHFDFGSAAFLSPNGVYAMADGQIVAYRMDAEPLSIRYVGNTESTNYSSSFVLIKHKLQLPPKPAAPAPAGAPPAPPARAPAKPATPPAKPTTFLQDVKNTLSDWYDSAADYFDLDDKPAPGPAQPAKPAPAAPAPAPAAPADSITLYSLYMHLRHSGAYSSDATLAKPPYLAAKYKVKPGLKNAVGLRIRSAPGGQVLGLIPLLSKVTLGAVHATNSKWKKFVSTSHTLLPLGAAITEGYVFANELTASYVKEKCKDTEPDFAGPKVTYVYDKGSSGGKKIANLPEGALVVLGEKSKADASFYELKAVENMQNFPVPIGAPGKILGYVDIDDLEAQPFTVPAGVQVLATPVDVKAGELIGHPGIFQNHNNVTQQIQLHVELFTADDLPGFIAKGKAWAQGAHVKEADKTLLKVPAGTKLIAARLDAAGKLITPVNPKPKLTDAGTAIHSELILPLGALNALKAEYKLSVPESTAANAAKVRWWYLDNIAGQASGSKLKGWLCEKNTAKVSPWEWSGFTKVEDATSDEKLIAYQLELGNKLRGEELSTYTNIESEGQNFPVIKKLIETIKSHKVDCATVPTPAALTPALLKDANKGFWCAQKIASIYLKTKTEWKSDPARWNKLDKIMGHLPATPNPNWLKEKEKIEKLSFWAAVSRVVGGADQVWYLNPILMGSFFTFDNLLVSAEQLKQIMPTISSSDLDKYLLPINEIMEKYEINTKIKIAHFLAQIGHETHDLYYKEEIASGSAYEGRADLGNTQTGDGKKFKGRGFIQLTGRANYKAFELYVGRDLTTGDNPKLVATDARLTIESAAWFWVNHKLFNKDVNHYIAGEEAIYYVSVFVNGRKVQPKNKRVYPDKQKEPNGMKDRLERFNRAKSVFGIS